MIIIGEKINGAIPSVADAIARRDEAFIKDLVHRQENAGADYLDICAGTVPEEERAAMDWLLELVQAETDLPLCVDSPDPHVIEYILPKVKKPGLINSVSAENDKCEVIFPLIQGTEWKVVALTCDNAGIPTNVERRVEIGKALIEKAAEYDIAPDRIFIDPLVLSLSAVNDAMLCFMQTICELKEAYPTVHITSGLSNISYGMPYRRIVNQNFLALALYAGMDSAIIDPTNSDLIGSAYAVEALLNRDRHCRQYNKAYRKGMFGNKK